MPDIILPFGLADWSLELRQALYVFPFVLAKEKPTFL